MKKIKYFTASWCPSCKNLKPIIEEVMKEISEDILLEIIDVDNNQKYAIEYGIKSIPVLSFTKNDIELERIIGLQSKQVLLSLINKNYN
jgi:thioredoxin 1